MRELDPNGLIAEGLLLAGALYGLWVARRALREGRAIRDTPTSRVRSAAQGYVELDGIGRLPAGVQTQGPLTRLPCTWWSFKIEEVDAKRRSRGWSVVERGTSVTPFVLDDGTGACLIDPRGAQVFGAHKTVWYGSTRRPEVRIPDGTSILGKLADLLMRGDFRYTELRLMVDAPLYAIGEFGSVGGNGGVAATSDPGFAVAQLLREFEKSGALTVGRDARGIRPASLEAFDQIYDTLVNGLADWAMLMKSFVKG